MTYTNHEDTCHRTDDHYHCPLSHCEEGFPIEDFEAFHLHELTHDTAELFREIAWAVAVNSLLIEALEKEPLLHSLAMTNVEILRAELETHGGHP